VRAYYFTRKTRTLRPAAPDRPTKSRSRRASACTAITSSESRLLGRRFVPLLVAVQRLYVSTSHLAPPCGKNVQPAVNPDDTLPGFELSTLYEAYLQYKDPAFYAKVGNQVYNQPWANASDLRIKPAAFQGFDAVGNFNSDFNAQVSWMWQYQNRTSSSFTQNTLITSYPGR